MNIDLYILAFSAVTVAVTIWMGFRSAKKSKTASDFFVAGRSVGVGMNASAISGEYLSAASFMGIAGMVMSSGYDALWYPVCYACGYLFLLLFIAGPLRRFGAYTIPDFAEGRFDSPVFRKIAVVFVLFIGFFYTMPQMKGAGTTLAYIFPGLPYWAGVVLVGAVITLNVALGGMKGITLVQAFQYWAKMFAISVPIFVLMAVYGHYGKQVGVNGAQKPSIVELLETDEALSAQFRTLNTEFSHSQTLRGTLDKIKSALLLKQPLPVVNWRTQVPLGTNTMGMDSTAPALIFLEAATRRVVLWQTNLQQVGKFDLTLTHNASTTDEDFAWQLRTGMQINGVAFFDGPHNTIFALKSADAKKLHLAHEGMPGPRQPLPAKAPGDTTWLNPFGPLTTKAAKTAAAAIGKKATDGGAKDRGAGLSVPSLLAKDGNFEQTFKNRLTVRDAVYQYAQLMQRKPLHSGMPSLDRLDQMLNGRLTVYGLVRSPPLPTNIIEFVSASPASSASLDEASGEIYNAGLSLKPVRSSDRTVVVMRTSSGSVLANASPEVLAKAAVDIVESTVRMTRAARAFDLWVVLNRLDVELIPVGDEYLVARMREKSVRASLSKGLPTGTSKPVLQPVALRAGLSPDQRMTVPLDSLTVTQALGVYAELTGRQLLPNTNSLGERADELLGGKLSQLKLVTRTSGPDSGVREHGDGAFTAAEVKTTIEERLRASGWVVQAVGTSSLRAVPANRELDLGNKDQGQPGSYSGQTSAAGGATSDERGKAAEKAWLAKHEKPLALLYTYSLIIAIVCGTAGLPHILVRFYTNPDGVAAKRTTMWVMILIGVFYVFPPVFGALGRNLLPDLYNGVGAKGTDKIVLELPRILNEKYPPLGSILSGITCAGAFAAFMSTFSGLLVSMTGALAHDVYGRIFRPKSTPEQRMRMFKIGAVLIGGVSILLGMQVEQLQINFMVGQAFAIAAASYFPLLFMAVWWRGLTMKGAATGMLTGGVAALLCISLTSFSDLAAAPKASSFFQLFAGLNPFWAAHPLLRILAEQPAIWAVPLAITLMIIVSKLTARTVPSDVRMKMLVLHAPEQLGLKQEYIQEHQPH